MRLTPLDVQNHPFATRFRGCDPEEVMTFLRFVSEDYEGLVRENEGQVDRIRRLERRVEELAAQEHLLKETLVSAKEMTDQMSRTAEREADLRLAEVEVRAEKILDASHRRVARLSQDISEMRGLRSRLAESMRSAAETHLALLETLESGSEHEALVQGLEEGTIALLNRELRPTSAEAESAVQPAEYIEDPSPAG